MSFCKLFRCGGKCVGPSVDSQSKDESFLLWLSVGVVFFVLFTTTAFGPARKDRESSSQKNILPSDVLVEPSLSPERVQQHVESFDVVWNTVNERHWDPAHLEAVGWEAARDELRPQIETVVSDGQAIEIMSELLDRLRLSHYQIIPAAAYDESERAGGDGMTGISVRILDGRAVVFRVEPESPADIAGVRPGWIIEAIGDREAAEAIARLQEREAITGDRPGVFSSMAIEGRLRGAVGDTIEVRFLDERDEQRDIEMVLSRSTDPLFEAANLPPMPVNIRFERLDSGVGYFAFSAFLDPARLMPAFEQAVNGTRDLDGMVIDLRGNLGGIIALCNGIGGWLLTETPSAELGRLSTRAADLRLVMNRRAQPLGLPVAVIIDERSISSAEILAGGLQDTGVARVFGSTSAGMSLPSVVQRLPNGDSFQYAFANYMSASGRELEKNGVEPDETVALTREALTAGTDPALAAAIAWIQAQARPAQSR